MKKVLLILVCVMAGAGGAVYWMKTHGAGAAPAAEKAADEEGGGPKISRDTNGNAVVTMDDETQGNIGLKVALPVAAQLSPEVKAYGKVLDPTPLAALLTELATDQAAYAASSNDLVRLKTLAGQGNASTRALQAAEAAALRDQLAGQSARDRLALSWGAAVADQKDLPAFIQSLTSLGALLIRIDLPAGETMPAAPAGARIVKLSGQSTDATYLAAASNVDPQTQGQGLIFLAKANDLGLLPGEAVTGFVKIPGEPIPGVVIPREAVVRAEGAAWVYVQGADGERYTRTEITLNHPMENGWLVTNAVTAANYVVTTGAQTLLSEELKASLKPD